MRPYQGLHFRISLESWVVPSLSVLQHTQGCTIGVSRVITGFMQPMQLVSTYRVGNKIWGIWCFFPTHIENARLSHYEEK